jgi:phytanoyl-CoA dioxygenase PhyH
LKYEKEKSINKIGHALHDLDPVFERFSRSQKIKDVATAIGIKNPLLLQSMYIFKQPDIGGEVTCHQDSTSLYTDPIDIVGLWFALEDATIENGCLWAIPGGHRSGLKSRWVRSTEGMKFAVLSESRTEILKRVNLWTLLTVRKVRVKASEVRSKITICKTYVTKMIPGGKLHSRHWKQSWEWATSPANCNHHKRSLKHSKRRIRIFFPRSPPEESYVKLKDRVIQVLED